MSNDEVRPSRELMRKREEELVRRQLSFLPEIKQAINHYLELSQASAYSSNLQTTLSRLEEFPDIQEVFKKNDWKELFTLHGKLEGIKIAAVREILTMRTNLASGLNDRRAGRRIIKDISGHIKSDFFVNRLWTAEILPSFDMPARIVVVYQPTYYRITFGVGASPDNASSSVAQVELPQSWTDPLETILCKLDLFHDESGLSLDGIGYEFDYLTLGSKTHIHFANPSYSQFVELEKAIFSVAETVVNKKGQPAENDYLAIWRKYLVQPKNA